MTHKWWQSGIIYQIYPRSFQDSNGDGIGDLPGITQRLDYLKTLNIDTIWISPIYPSPMHDFGYDVADYTDINPMFGTLADFDHLLAEAHQRGLKVLLDLVPNHSSDEHAWFIESRASRDNPKRDWYIWRDPAPDGGPPNNWRSFFGDPAWTFDETTGQYYLHQFVTQQPELNYRNPEVLTAMLDVIRFWLNRGIDGFRVDVIWLMIKDELLRDEPINPNWDGIDPFNELQHIYTANVPGIHELIQAFRAVFDAYDDRMMVGEIYLPYPELVKYYGQGKPECHLPFNFGLIVSDWNAQAVRQLVEEYEANLPADGWPNWVLGNHDRHRIATRAGYDQARVAMMLLLTLRGTPTMYYGDELGMENGHIPPEFVQDPPAVNQPEIAHIVGRDPVRTPMQWNGEANAGFSPAGVTTWLPVTDNYQSRNVAVQAQDAASMLAFTRQLAALRRAEPALSIGAYQTVPYVAYVPYDEADGSNVFAYQRTAPSGEAMLVVLNFAGDNLTLDLSTVAPTATVALSTTLTRDGDVDLATLALAGHEGLVLRL